jgi:hypothetical protein
VTLQSYRAYYGDELDVNSQFRRFVINTSILYGGYNTVAEQIKINARWARNKGDQRLLV